VARIFEDSADTYTTATASLKWDQVGDITVVSGISGMTNNCILMLAPGGQNPVVARKNLPSSYGTLVSGMRLRSSILPVSNYKIITSWWDTGNMNIALFGDSSGRITAWVGNNSDEPDLPHGTMIAQTPSGVLRPSTNIYLEWEVAFATSATGSITIRVNSQALITVSTVITGGFSATSNQFGIHAAGNDFWNGWYFDDIYVNDTSGSVNNGFSGDQQLLVRLPTGPGASTQWSIGGSSPAATNWQSVNEVPPDGDVTYVSAGSTGLVDLYTIAPLPVNVVSVTAAQMLLDSKTDASGLGAGATIAPVLGDGGIHTPNVGTAVSRNTDYNYVLQSYDINPLTGVAWTAADFNILQIGQKRVL
jgi:hypothetical protein